MDSTQETTVCEQLHGTDAQDSTRAATVCELYMQPMHRDLAGVEAACLACGPAHLDDEVVLAHFTIAHKAAHGRDGLVGRVEVGAGTMVAVLLAHFVHLHSLWSGQRACMLLLARASRSPWSGQRVRAAAGGSPSIAPATSALMTDIAKGQAELRAAPH
jgi:hypothetical protein